MAAHRLLEAPAKEDEPPRVSGKSSRLSPAASAWAVWMLAYSGGSRQCQGQ